MRAVYFCLLVTLLLIYGRVLFKVLKNSDGLTPILGWMIGLGYFVLGPLFILTLNGGFELPAAYGIDNRWGRVDLTNATFLLPYLVIWVSMVATALTVDTFFTRFEGSSSWLYSIPRRKLERVLLVCMGIAVALWSLQIYLVGGIAQFLVSHWYERGEDLFNQYGDSYVLVAHVSLANQILFTGAAGLYAGCGAKNRNTKAWFTVFIVLFYLCGVVMTGNRIFLAIYLLAIVTSFWVLQRRKLIAILVGVSPLLIIVFSAWSAVRHDISHIPDSVSAYTQSETYGNRTVTSLMNVTEGMAAMLLFHVVNDFGSRYELLYGQTYSRAFTSLIPRRIYPHKPENFTVLLAKIYQPNVTTSLNATAIGEMYANFGPLTLILFPILTLGIVKLNGWILTKQQAHPLLPAVLFVLLVWVARATLADNLIQFGLALCMIVMFRLEKGLRLAEIFHH